MAILAGIACTNVIDIFADRIGTIVTAEAITGEICVIKIRRQPAGRCVAIVTIVATRNVCRVLSFRDRAVVT